MKMYEVGGCVRDELLGVPSKDIDFTVVLDPNTEILDGKGSRNLTVGELSDPFGLMVAELRGMGFEIFLETPEFFTARARFPKVGINQQRPGVTDPHPLDTYHGMTADFVLARKESGYSDGRRPDRVELGTLEDDLARRDFTMNAIAKDPMSGELIDPFGGIPDLEGRVLRAVGEPLDRLTEDALRAVRALRFSVTKGFEIDPSLAFAMQTQVVLDSIRDNISDERIDEELRKMFAHDTLASLAVLRTFPLLTGAVFSGSVRLTSTMKKGPRR